MPLQTQSRTIGELDVDTTQLPARRAIKLAGKLGRVIGPALSKAKGLSMQSDIADLAPALTAFFTSLSDTEYDALLLEILSSTVVTGVCGDVAERRRVQLDSLKKIDDAFGADMSGLVKVAAFALEVNFRDFMGGVLRGPAAALQGAAAGA